MSGFLEEKKLNLKKVAAKKWFFYNKNYDVKNFFNHDNVAVFPEIRLCFNRIKKSGNSSVCAYLAEVCGYPDYDSPEALKKHLLRPEHLSFRQLGSLKSYHSLVVVREPFERALSAFLDKIAHDTSERFRQYEGYHDVNADGFSRFLKHLDEKGQQVNRHFWPQTDLLYKPLEDFSLVAKLENLSEVLPPFLETVCGRTIDRDHLSAPHEMEAQKAGNVTRAKNKLKYFYREESISLIRKIYRKDFEKLEYSEKFSVWVFKMRVVNYTCPIERSVYIPFYNLKLSIARSGVLKLLHRQELGSRADCARSTIFSASAGAVFFWWSLVFRGSIPYRL